MRIARRRAFTLVELLVVISIIALLLTIIFPSLRHARSLARRVLCANNLHNIGTAYATQKSHEKIGQAAKLRAVAWHAFLVRHVGDNWAVFTCPEDKDLTTDSGEDPSGGTQGTPGTPGWDPDISDVFVEVFVTRLDNPADYRWDMYMNESSEWCWKLSQPQWDVCWGQGRARNYNYTGYEPDGHPDHYYYAWEDQGWRGGGDRDYWDIALEIQHYEGRTDVTVYHGYSAFSFNLRRGDDRELLIHDMQAKAGSTITFEGGLDIPGWLSQLGLSGMLGGPTSYGMNSTVGRITQGSNTILVLDYYRLVARCSSREDQAIDEGWLNEAVVRYFARHFGKCNVLFDDQRVELLLPSQIDPHSPASQEVQERYWDPQ